MCHAVLFGVVLYSRVSPEDIQHCEDRFNKSKMVHSIMRHVAETTGENLEVSNRGGWRGVCGTIRWRGLHG